MAGLTFLEKSPEAILKDIVDHWQKISGRVLYPSQIENLELHTLAYRESLLRNDIQRCAEQNLVSFAVGRHLDELGSNLETPRLQPAPAECTVQFALDVPSPMGASFAPGTRVTTQDGAVAFETLTASYVISGQGVSSHVRARCITAGTEGNGLGPGVLCCLDPKQAGVSVANLDATYGGGGLEGDEAYRVRLLLSSARFGGGTANGYRLAALTASSEVSDALAVGSSEGSDNNGNIYVYVLSKEGEPPIGLLAKVADFCNKPDVRIINDWVVAVAAREVKYAIKAKITVFADHDPAIIQDKVRALAYGFASKHMAKLGQDVTPTQVLLALSPVGDGLYHVELEEPSGIIKIGPSEWANASEIEIAIGGVAG